MRNPSPHYPLVHIEWHDAYSNPSWMSRSDYDEWYNPSHMTVHEVGWLVEKNKSCVVVASRFNPRSGQYGLFQMIPTTWCKVKTLAKPCKS